jgi:flavin reductase (DIM6/NTAB) family NADH-FMN oxidoreductase RutF
MKISHLTAGNLEGMERFYRANLVNSVTGYKPAMLIGTHNGNGSLNLAIFSSVVHLGADPALIGFIQRPVGISGDTFRNIALTGEFTINHIHQDFVANAHFTSAKFPAEVSEFDACQLTPTFITGFSAPFVLQSHVRLGLEFIEAIPIRHNNTTLVIGKLCHLFLPEEAIEHDGNLNLSKVKTVCVSGLETYHQVQPLTRFPYAKPENIPSFES